jgi:cysteinyl-tRNA synthetase
MIKFYNTLTRKKEDFIPIKKDSVFMYTCGPTVYDFAHIGNLKAYVFSDTLRRALEYSNYKVFQVMNTTDIGHLTSDEDEGEDKMMKGLKREGKPLTLEAMKELANFYTTRFLENLDELNITPPNVLAKASEHVVDQIELIKKLEQKGFIYTITDGVYFDTSKKEGYGELAKLDIENLKEGARVLKNTEKKNPIDFALWKFNDVLGWESPWGKGFPGWHIECSAMSMKYLGPHFDIHTGGIDHIPVHHTNEIAQSEAATEEKFVNYWMHSGFININDGKMAKSEGNFITLKTFEEHDINPIAYRYWLLTADYKKTINFTWDTVAGAEVALNKLYSHFVELPEGGSIISEYKNKFIEYINDDLNTAEGIALLWDLIKDKEVSDKDKKVTILDFDKVLGLKFDEQKHIEIPNDIKKMIDDRESARSKKDWDKADEIREKINKLGYDIEDTESDVKVRRL